jgi:predicted RNase H-like HicB family nuclease
MTMRYAIVIEGEPGSYSAYVPDLPGCVVAAETLNEIHQEMQAAIAFHIEGLLEEGLSVPAPLTTVDWVEVSS